MGKAISTLTQQLKGAIAAAVKGGKSLYAIAKGSNVDHTVVQRFMAEDEDEKRDIRLGTADRIASYLELELRPRDKKSK